MERFLCAVVLLAAPGPGHSLFGDRVNPWAESGYSDEPGWSATVEAYRQMQYRKREELQRIAGENAILIACVLAAAILVAFVVGSFAVWQLTGKEADALHAYVLEHQQHADDVDRDTGAQEALKKKYSERGRVGLGQTTDASESTELDYMERVDGRFGHSSHVLDTPKDARASLSRMEKLKKRNAHIDSAVERAFLAVDTDESGELTRDEIQQLLQKMHQQHSDEHVDALMEELDPDNSGTVSITEFHDFWVEHNALAVKNADSGSNSKSSVVSASKKAARENR